MYLLYLRQGLIEFNISLSTLQPRSFLGKKVPIYISNKSPSKMTIMTKLGGQYFSNNKIEFHLTKGEKEAPLPWSCQSKSLK